MLIGIVRNPHLGNHAKSGQWLSPEKQPTEELIQDVDPDAGITLHQREQCFE